MAEKLAYCGKIEARVMELERNGVTRSAIFEAIQSYQLAPRSSTTFWKMYKPAMERVHADTASQIGGKIVEQAIAGDFKSQELYLKTKGGWNTHTTNINVEADANTDNSALETLLDRLKGKSEEPPKED